MASTKSTHTFWLCVFGFLAVLIAGSSLAAGSILAAPRPTPDSGPLVAPLVTDTPTSTPIPACGPGSNYIVTSSLGDIVPGTTLVPGSQCEDCVTVIPLPFTYSLYDSSHNSLFAGVNGNLQFNTDYPTAANVCIPAAGFPRVILPHWDDLSTSGPGLGIYTSTSGAAPDRIFNIEWRATYAGTGGLVNFEVRLYEGQRKFDVIFNHVDQEGSGATVGVQHSPVSLYTQYACNTAASLQPGLLLTFVQPICDTSTPTPTITNTPTRTPTLTRTPTATPICPPAQRMVLMTDFQYMPATVVITAGTTVRWMNQGPSQHTSTSDTGVWDSGALNPGQVFNFTLYTPGTYPYHCTLHPGMTGTITVQEGCKITPTPPATATPTPSCVSSWSLVPSPNSGSLDNYLFGIDAVSSTDIWAVGYYYDGFASRTLIEHWNGTSWSVVSSPNVGSSANVLQDVEAVASNDVWAVGYAGLQTLILRWNGNAWNVVSSPNPGTGFNSLLGIEVVAPNDIWAVGHYQPTNGSAYRTLVLRWNGAFWGFVPSPNVGTNDNFLWGGIAAAAPDDVWAAGSYGANGSRQTLVLHWNGSAWSVVSSPNAGPLENRLHDLAAASPSEVWAVGYYGSFPNEQTLIQRWDGTQWAIVPGATLGAGRSMLFGATAISPGNVWAVGFHANGTLTERWDGTAWAVVPSPNQSGANLLSAITTVAGNAWSVGYYDLSNLRRTLTLRFSSAGPACPTLTPTATATPTRTPTATPVCPPVTRMVLMVNLQYMPPTATIVAGSTIRWMNEGPSQHTTTSDTGLWDSGVLNPGQLFSHVFNTPGTYPYHCTLHAGMTGTIEVTACGTPTPTPTPVLVGHVEWQARPPQPDPLQQLPITLTLRSTTGGPYFDYPSQTTDASGYFTIPLGDQPPGDYNWYVKGPHASPDTNTTPGYLANTGSIQLNVTGYRLQVGSSESSTFNLEIGEMRAGDSSNDNVVDVSDFNILKRSFGVSSGDPGFDPRADFDGDLTVDVVDFNALKANFGTLGAPPL